MTNKLVIVVSDSGCRCRNRKSRKKADSDNDHDNDDGGYRSGGYRHPVLGQMFLSDGQPAFRDRIREVLLPERRPGRHR